MPQDSVFEAIMKCIDPMPGEIDELIRKYNIPPSDFFAKAAACSCCNDI